MIKKILFSTLFAILLTTVPQVSVQASGYPDVPRGSWYESAVLLLTERGAVNGFPDGSFRPDQTVKADEFIKMLMLMLDGQKRAADTHWASGYMKAAEALGILRQGEITDPRRPINRAEMTMFVMRALGENAKEAYFVYQKNMTDYAVLPVRYRGNVLTAYALGIINGINGSFIPYSEPTRKEACAVLARMADEKLRLDNRPAGETDGFVTASALISMLEMKGYLTEEVNEGDKTLTRNDAAEILCRTILATHNLRADIIPETMEVIDPVVFSDNTPVISDTFESLIHNSGSIRQNLHAMQFYEIIKRFSDGRIEKIINVNLFADRNAFLSATEDLEGMKQLSLEAPARPFDHTRFIDIFSDSAAASEAFLKLYDLGIMDAVSYSEYSGHVFCAPDAPFTRSELDVILMKLENPEMRSVFDEKEFGVSDSWGKDLFGSAKYTVRLSEMSALRIFDLAEMSGMARSRIYLADTGIAMECVSSDEPYFDDVIIIDSDPAKGACSHNETVSEADFRKFDISRYAMFAPLGYSSKFNSDMDSFLGSAGTVFEGLYGDLGFNAVRESARGIDMIRFSYAFGKEQR